MSPRRARGRVAPAGVATRARVARAAPVQEREDDVFDEPEEAAPEIEEEVNQNVPPVDQAAVVAPPVNCSQKNLFLSEHN